MTLVKVETTHDGATGGKAALYRLSSPLTGANNVVVTASGSVVIISGAISFTGENATTPLGTPVSAFGSSGTITVNVTGTATSSIIVDCASAGSSIPSDNQTAVWVRNVNGSSYGNNGRSQRANGTGGTVTMAHGDAGDGWATVAVEIKD
jgi:hypothetical protein